MNYKPDTNFKYYPHFRLPTLQEYKIALHFADSVDKSTCQKIQCDIIPCINDTDKINPTVITKLSVSKNKNTIYNLRGNVREWIDEKNISVGGGWSDSRQKIFSQDTFYLQTENASTGFRNVCEWKRWTK